MRRDTEPEIEKAKSLLRQNGYRIVRIEDIRTFATSVDVPDHHLHYRQQDRSLYMQHSMERQAIDMGHHLYRADAINFETIPLNKRHFSRGSRIEARLTLIMPFTRGD